MSFKQMILTAIAALALIFSSVFCMKATWCGIKAKDMGISSKYTLVSGCLVSEKGNIWIAPDKFRNVVD